MSKKSLIDRIVYAITSKPKHCVKVRNPPKTARQKLSRPQAARQEQYNRWSKRFKVYSGSYLPENDRRLLKKGWEDKKLYGDGGVVMQRKSTGQTVKSETHGKPHHYHWMDFWEKPYRHSRFKKVRNRGFSHENVYYNKYGELTHQWDPEHHIYGDEKDD